MMNQTQQRTIHRDELETVTHPQRADILEKFRWFDSLNRNGDGQSAQQHGVKHHLDITQMGRSHYNPPFFCQSGLDVLPTSHCYQTLNGLRV
jgi:hypothetical protein